MTTSLAELSDPSVLGKPELIIPVCKDIVDKASNGKRVRLNRDSKLIILAGLESSGTLDLLSRLWHIDAHYHSCLRNLGSVTARKFG